MGNRLFKRGCLCVMIIMSLLLQGCAKKYEPKNAALLNDMELDLLYDEVNGYHIPGLFWDMKKNEVEEQIQASLGNASEGLEKTYYLENDDIEKINGFVTSNADYAFSPEGTLVNVTYNFYAEDYKAEELDEFYEQVKEELTENYGPADAEEESSAEQGKILFFTRTCRWEKKLPDGRISSLQVAKADRGEATEVVSVGVTVYSDEKGEER